MVERGRRVCTRVRRSLFKSVLQAEVWSIVTAITSKIGLNYDDCQAQHSYAQYDLPQHGHVEGGIFERMPAYIYIYIYLFIYLFIQ